MNDYVAQVRSVLRACTVESTSAYSWFGGVHRTPQGGHLTANLQHRLYTEFYCQGSATRLTGAVPARLAVPVRTMPFVEQLSAANAGTGHRQGGWTVRRVEGATAWVSRDGLEVRVHRGACTAPDRNNPRPGDEVWLRLPKESRAGSWGFYLARSDTALPADWQRRLVRLYWNVTPAGAVRLMSGMSRSLNGAGVPFVLKVWTNAQEAMRCDTAVLYAHARDCRAVAEAVAGVYPHLNGDLRGPAPALTKPLAVGLGFAEDPGGGESFGMHRSRLLAEGLVRAHEAGMRSPDGRLEKITDYLAACGVDLDRPYLNADSPGEPAFPLPVPARARSSPSGALAPGPEPEPDVLLGTAHDLGRQLVEAALWHGDRCTWVGARPGSHETGRGAAVDYATLGPDLYSGTAGVALFLAQLYSAAGDESCRRTALGAVRQSLDRLDAVPPEARLGLYTGWTGVAYGAARTGRLLGADQLLDRSRGLLLRCETELTRPTPQFDLLSGASGAIVALLNLRHLLADERLVDIAAALGSRLVGAAEESDAGLSWRRPTAPSERNLTGFSHGAAGAAHALLELFHATGIVEYRDAAMRAFAYERRWFDSDVGNWPDFRGQRRRRRAGPGSFPFAVSGATALPALRCPGYARTHCCRRKF